MTVDMLQDQEYAPYYKPYLSLVPKKNLLEALHDSKVESMEFYNQLNEEQLTTSYAEGKWTPKEILVHVMDTERIFNYRALRFARKDEIDLPGYEQDDYVGPSMANEREIASILEEYETQRKSSILLFKNFTDEMLERSGSGSGRPMSVRAAGFIHVGHEMHHIQVIKDRYL